MNIMIADVKWENEGEEKHIKQIRAMLTDRYYAEVKKNYNKIGDYYIPVEDFKILVTWNKEEYRLFVSYMKEHGLDYSGKRHIVLKELIEALDSEYSRGYIKYDEVAYKYTKNYQGIKSPNSTSKILKEFSDNYMALCRKYKTRITLTKDGVVHSKKCSCLKNHSRDDISSINATAILSGMPICSECLKNKNFIKMRSDYKYLDKISITEENVNEICKVFNIKNRCAEGVIFLSTGYGNWRIVYEYNRIIDLYHENTRPNAKSSRSFHSFKSGYHRQDGEFGNIFDAIYYIAEHDKHLFTGSRLQENKISRLLKQAGIR